MVRGACHLTSSYHLDSFSSSSLSACVSRDQLPLHNPILLFSENILCLHWFNSKSDFQVPVECGMYSLQNHVCFDEQYEYDECFLHQS